KKIQNIILHFYNITALGYCYQQAIVYIAFFMRFAWERALLPVSIISYAKYYSIMLHTLPTRASPYFT
ncbi:hypothetical protein CE195_08320, partial [Sodalis-like symbiont of Philaenus spumarius]